MPDPLGSTWNEADVAHLLQEARAEALHELKRQLKDRILAALVAGAGDLLGPTAPGSAPAEPLAPSAAPVAQPLAVQLDVPVRLGYYVYGVLPSGACPDELPAGIDPAHPVFLMGFRDLQLLVSQVPMHDFGEDALQTRLDDTDWTRRTLRAHQGILRHVQRQTAVLPMRFCTICHDEAGVRHLLEANYDDFICTIGLLNDAQEWSLRIYCDDARLQQCMTRLSERAQELQATLRLQPEGTAHFTRKKLREVLVEEAAVFGKACVEQCHRMLDEVSKKSTLGVKAEAGRSARSERLVLGSAYLVARDRWEVFRNRLELMEASYRPFGFSFELSGPWAPQHFLQTALADPTGTVVARG